ncbi:uracil-DNA glycosylase family protein [Aureitalea marina]|uniref:DNA glycosylase n=1 Tax=Aureitalea marina TaxID=930804 RepID=A0A2S7KQM7_9FLAO|nr:uracil-DNA glycosylase family protein [Aureitalea marina]PQB04873.1 DNA glycosylase [Aureitalea marina]
MFVHRHPYDPFIPKGSAKLIVGTLPPPRFTNGELKPGDVNFCYGSRDGQLWPILDRIFDLGLNFETTQQAIDQRKDFLVQRKIGICDIVQEALREKIDATDLGMQSVQLRDLIAILNVHPSVNTLLFTGGNSKNGPEYFFRRLLKQYDLKLKVENSEVPRIHSFVHPQSGKLIKTVSLIAPSGSANRAVGSLVQYKELKAKDPAFNTIDFRVLQYSNHF